MGRPKASDSVREFAACFARAVTVSSKREHDWVARTGRHSLYSVLSVVAPKACRLQGSSDCNRSGITEAELNKHLENNGFFRVRVRIRCIVSSAGTWLFGERRWLDPKVQEDHNLLLKGYHALREQYPRLLDQDERTFIGAVSAMQDDWAKRRYGVDSFMVEKSRHCNAVSQATQGVQLTSMFAPPAIMIPPAQVGRCGAQTTAPVMLHPTTSAASSRPLAVDFAQAGNCNRPQVKVEPGMCAGRSALLMNIQPHPALPSPATTADLRPSRREEHNPATDFQLQQVRMVSQPPNNLPPLLGHSSLPGARPAESTAYDLPLRVTHGDAQLKAIHDVSPLCHGAALPTMTPPQAVTLAATPALHGPGISQPLGKPELPAAVVAGAACAASAAHRCHYPAAAATQGARAQSPYDIDSAREDGSPAPPLLLRAGANANAAGCYAGARGGAAGGAGWEDEEWISADASPIHGIDDLILDLPKASPAGEWGWGVSAHPPRHAAAATAAAGGSDAASRW